MLTNAWCLEDFFNVCKLMKFQKFKISQKKKKKTDKDSGTRYDCSYACLFGKTCLYLERDAYYQ